MKQETEPGSTANMRRLVHVTLHTLSRNGGHGSQQAQHQQAQQGHAAAGRGEAPHGGSFTPPHGVLPRCLVWRKHGTARHGEHGSTAAASRHRGGWGPFSACPALVHLASLASPEFYIALEPNFSHSSFTFRELLLANIKTV